MAFFKCRCCGECCRGEMKVFLNPEDLTLIADFLGCSPEQVFTGGYAMVDSRGNGAPLPRIRFRRGAAQFCPFLENGLDEDGQLSGLCMLHPGYKPLVCMLAPGSRTIDLDAGTEVRGVEIPLPGCPGFDDESVKAEYDAAQFFSPEIETRLEAEKKFFAELKKLLDSGVHSDTIINKLYYGKE